MRYRIEKMTRFFFRNSNRKSADRIEGEVPLGIILSFIAVGGNLCGRRGIYIEPRRHGGVAQSCAALGRKMPRPAPKRVLRPTHLQIRLSGDVILNMPRNLNKGQQNRGTYVPKSAAHRTSAVLHFQNCYP